MWNWIQARAIVESDSIPRAFLDATAYRLWSIKSYAHFCLLARISWGRGFRQWIVTAVYFGLQGFMSALVTLPRLIVYGFILYSVRGIPDLALSSATFEMLGIDGFSALRCGLLKGSLVVIALSAILHTLYTVKLLIAAAMCSCTICCLGRLKKTMDKDLRTRITDLVVSTCGHNDNNRFSGLHGEVKVDIDNLPHSGLESTGENQNTGAALPLEKDSSLHQQPSEGLDTHLYSLQDSFDGIVLGSDKRRASSHHNNGEPIITVHISPPTDAMPDAIPTDAVLARDQGSLQDSSASHSPDRHQTPLTSTPPTMLGASQNADGAQSTRTNTSELDIRRPSCQSDTNHLMPGGPGGRFTSLSFYDDLLKSISSERMMYAASIYNQATPDLQQPQNEGDICGQESNNMTNEVMSIARCSSIPLTLPSCSESEYRSHAERPVHPFDVSQDHPTTTILFEQHPRPTMAELYVHPLDTADSSVAGFGNFPQPQSQERQSMSVYNNPLGLGQRGGPNSQEAIENWRVLVEPRSPALADLDYEVPKVLHLGSMDDAHDEFSDSISRRGTIPIILSGHLRDAAAIYEEDQFFTMEDLDAPRPFYAYGQTRTQRQGSVNSSTGGYNQSIASSPSLADSLSNPMYHQQSHGITNFNSTSSRPFQPRKCSLPGSIYSSTKDDAGSSAPYIQNQTSQASSAPSYLAYPSSATRTKAKTPSHLSNMIMHGDDINGVDTTEYQQSTSVQKKDHRRSQGAQLSQTNASSWDPFAKLAQTGCALTNIPHRGVDLNSLPQARAVLDTAFQLSPPFLRRHSSRQRENLALSSNADYTGGYDQRTGWNEQYVGLGLTFDSSTYTNQQRPLDMDESYRSPLDSYFDQTQNYPMQQHFQTHLRTNA
ncbi:hypothetical protein BGX34_008208 [Mortierella sp. NVP85]|nr:hypothetical protein BGX34_008208 [Mortierella sp. NVP85]